MRFLSTAAASAFGLLLVSLLPGLASPAVRGPGVPVVVRPAPEDPNDWVPPTWHPNADALTVLESFGGSAATPVKIPGLTARAAFVVDLDRGEVLYERRADERRTVASLTKLVSALAMSTESPDLDATWCVDPQFWPQRPGARSHLSTGECYRGWDYLGAALVASDNRGAYGMQVVSGLSFEGFIDRMNDVAHDLGMTASTWGDPSGLEDENQSTARDIARAVTAVAFQPTLAFAATAPEWRIERTDKPVARRLGSTDHIVERKDVEVLGAKTGYTDTAGYCFAAVVRTAGGRTVAFSILGAPRNGDRWADVDRVLAAVR